ncbi:uncharacterized protein B0H18DRAFT_1001277, partial [Fomitopsis serialis]|uniref:uncharacterized protein n=1 Tax=Fomitopsis serialis TaxID=139415 RepID=UPI0020089FCF
MAAPAPLSSPSVVSIFVSVSATAASSCCPAISAPRSLATSTRGETQRRALSHRPHCHRTATSGPRTPWSSLRLLRRAPPMLCRSMPGPSQRVGALHLLGRRAGLRTR